MKKHIIFIILFLYQPCSLNAAEIFVLKGKYNDYYHIKHTLTSQTTLLSIPVTERPPRYGSDNTYRFSEGGQFEIFIPKEHFPILAPKCRKYIIIRMPSTSPDVNDYQAAITEKYKLFKMIQDMVELKLGSIEVVLELNPYVRVLSQSPLKLELENCNVFFRHGYGHYRDWIDP